MLKHFSLNRVVKNEASFDPAKLTAFQGRYMNDLNMDTKVDICTSFLKQAKVVSDPVTENESAKIAAITAAADDRIELGGDILQFDGFFKEADSLSFEDKAFKKRLIKPESAGRLLAEFKKVLSTTSDFSAANMESVLKEWVEQQEIQIGDIIHALRVAVTGKAAGFGMFESLEILGQTESAKRIDVALERLEIERNKVDV